MSAVTPGNIGLPLERISVAPSGCWLWTGAHQTAGYGVVAVTVEREGRRARTTVPSHRISYEAVNGPIPAGLHIDHLCRVPACVNPAHLEAVTPRENALRGIGISARNAAKTHCMRGHEFTPENTYTYTRSWNSALKARRCKTCFNDRLARIRDEAAA